MLRIGNKRPDQNLRLELGFDPFNGALLIQAGAHQVSMIARQKAQHVTVGMLREQCQQRCIQLQRLTLAIEQRTRLWVVTQ